MNRQQRKKLDRAVREFSDRRNKERISQFKVGDKIKYDSGFKQYVYGIVVAVDSANRSTLTGHVGFVTFEITKIAEDCVMADIYRQQKTKRVHVSSVSLDQ